MRLLINIFLIALLSYYFQYNYQWWTMALAAFTINIFIPTTPWRSFSSGFLAVFGLWLFMAWKIDSDTNSILTSKMAQLFSLPDSFLLILISALIGGLIAGFASVTGFFLRDLFKRKKRGY
jgi:hypothetical protein